VFDAGVTDDRGIARARLEEGVRYLRGDGVRQDYGRARRALESAAPYEGRAALLLADMYERGWGVVPDMNLSLWWLHKGAEMGEAAAQYRLGELYLTGRPPLLQANPPLGVELLRRSAAQGHPGAQQRLQGLPPRE
jgi:TPR repeat protein